MQGPCAKNGVFFLARGVHYWSHDGSTGERGHERHAVSQTGPPLGLDGAFVHGSLSLCGHLLCVLQPDHNGSTGDVPCSTYNHILLGVLLFLGLLASI